MKRILFVDDEPNVLEGLQRMLFPMQREWTMAFAHSGSHALELLGQDRYDVIVSDMRMPGMDGAALLGEVRKRYPETIRFVLTGQSDSETIYRSVGAAHQFLSKPCKPNLLKECVDRAFVLRDLLANSTLGGLLSRIGALPPLPEAYAKLVEELRSPESSVGNIGHIIEGDIAMTVKILQLVNSAFFGLRRQVTSASQAASLLGVDTIKTLVLTVGIFSSMEKVAFPPSFSLEHLWRHSMKVGEYARLVCKSEDLPTHQQNETYTAGVLHDVGSIILASACKDDYDRAYRYAASNCVSLAEAERITLGCTHAEVGAFLMGIWGLPDNIVEAVAFHHRPCCAAGTTFSTLTAVHVADALFHEFEPPADCVAYPQLDDEYIADKLGLGPRVEAWRQACVNADAMKVNDHE